MTLALLFLMFFNAHGATGDYSDNDLWQESQKAIDPYRAQIRERLDPNTYLKITALREFVDFIKPIQDILIEALWSSEEHLPESRFEPERIDRSDYRLDPPLFAYALQYWRGSLPANKEGSIWVAEETELAKDPSKLTIFIEAGKSCITALHLFCQKREEAAKEYRIFLHQLSKDTFWQLAQKSIDPFREYVQAILTRANHSSLQDSDDFITFTTPLVKILEKATAHSRDYLSPHAFGSCRFDCESKRVNLDPPLFLQAFQRLQYLANQYDTETSKQKLVIAYPFLLKALLTFCNEERQGAKKGYDAFFNIQSEIN